MARICLSVLVLLASVFTASGCGGSAKSSSQAGQSSASSGSALSQLSRSELVAKANAICARADTELATIKIRTPQDYTRLLPQLAVYRRTAADELSKLIPPASLAADWKQLVTGAQTIADNTSKISEYAQSNNVTATKPVIAILTKTQSQMQATAARDGLTPCGEA